MEGLLKVAPRAPQAVARVGSTNSATGQTTKRLLQANCVTKQSKKFFSSSSLLSSPLIQGEANSPINTIINNNNNDHQDQRSSDSKHNYTSLNIAASLGDQHPLRPTSRHCRAACATTLSTISRPMPAQTSGRLLASLSLALVASTLLAGCLLGQLAATQAEGALILAGQAPTGGSGDESGREPAASRAALEAELNSILRQHEPQGANDKELAEAIFSRLMLGNLTTAANGADLAGSAAGELDVDALANNEVMGLMDANQQRQQAATTLNELTAAAALEANEPPNGLASAGSELAQARPSGPDSIRLKKLLNYLGNAEFAQLTGAGLNGGQVFSQFPVLPAGQAATIKRASAKMSNLLLRSQHQNQHQRQGAIGRNFDFGLGKRPDSSVSSNILRLGDSSLGNIQTVSGQLGKRPAHRYDFGLGKRVASPAYPRYDFGLGKRAPNRIRYDFGLGK